MPKVGKGWPGRAPGGGGVSFTVGGSVLEGGRRAEKGAMDGSTPGPRRSERGCREGGEGLKTLRGCCGVVVIELEGSAGVGALGV